MKIKAVRKKVGSSNTHYVIKHAYVSGTVYIDNDVANDNPEVKSFEFDIPMDEPE